MNQMIRKNYDVVIIGAGVQGLSLAYNLARNGMSNVVVLDKSYIGSGASGRNGEMIRSAFASEEWIRLFTKSVEIWETLADELDFNVMYTRCGYLVLASTAGELEACQANVALQKTFGLQTRLLQADEVRVFIPALNPKMVTGGVFQPNGGFARHDATVWAYAAAARRLKVDIVPFCEVTDIVVAHGAVQAVKTSQGTIETRTLVNAAGGHAGRIAHMAGVDLPSQTYRLEILVTEPLKPFLPIALSSPHTSSYMHQSTRGEFVGGAEVKNMVPTMRIKSSLEATCNMAETFVRLFPRLSAVRLMRQWAGIVDMAPDISPVLGPADAVHGFILDCGWVYGFMGAPAAGRFLADYILTGELPAEIKPFGVERFKTGKLIRDSSLVVPPENT